LARKKKTSIRYLNSGERKQPIPSPDKSNVNAVVSENTGSHRSSFLISANSRFVISEQGLKKIFFYP